MVRFMWLGIVIGTAFLWLALREVNVTSLLNSLKHARMWPIAPFVLALVLFYSLKALRWRALILSTYKFDTKALFIPMMLGFAVNNILPLRIGEVIRVYVASKLLAIPKSLLFATVIVERLFDVLAISIIVTTSIVYTTFSTYANIDSNPVLLSAISALFFSVAIVAFLVRLKAFDADKLKRLLPLNWQKRLSIPVYQFTEGLTAITGFWSAIFILINSLLQWSLMVLCIYLAMFAVDLDSPQMAMASMVLGLVVFGVSLPAGPGFIGTIEYAFVFGLGLFNIDADTAFAAALYYHALSFGFVLLVGAVCFYHYRRISGSGVVL